MQLKYRRCANLYSSECRLKDRLDLPEVEPGKEIPTVSYPEDFADADKICNKCDKFEEKA